MLFFKPNANRQSNINNSTIKNSVTNKNIFKELSQLFNYTPQILRITKLKQIRSIDRATSVPKNNDRRNVRKPLDTTAIRDNQRNYFTGNFNDGFPRPSNYPLCPQKISTVFQSGIVHYTTSTTSSSQSYPMIQNFVKVTDILRLPSPDCVCYYVDFSGNYILNWSLEEGGQLLSSDNPDVTLGTFTFYESENYFEIFLYPNPTLNNVSYVHIRYRIPIRYRYAYGDWTFWESLIIDNTLSETEFVKVINCCTNDTTLLQPTLINS